jgi:hypothetical protein
MAVGCLQVVQGAILPVEEELQNGEYWLGLTGIVGGKMGHTESRGRACATRLRGASTAWGLVLIINIALVSSSLADSKKGEFRGRIVAEWNADGRSMRLLEPFEYVATDGRRWPVPKDAVVDGASIPQVFWSLIGSPFSGLYRAPSVVHDYFCEVRTRRSADVHRTFYDAMLSAGVEARRAWLMYQAVVKFGPHWDDPQVPPGCEIVDRNYDFNRCARNAPKPPVQRRLVDSVNLREFAKEIEGQIEPSDLAALRKIAEQRK